jgi:hypothetical protein
MGAKVQQKEPKTFFNIDKYKIIAFRKFINITRTLEKDLLFISTV